MKRLSELKVGDKITHYCFGKIVEATVKEVLKNGVLTEHEPVQWGRDAFSESSVLESSGLQKKWGGTDENGQPCKGADTTPKAWYNGTEITI